MFSNLIHTLHTIIGKINLGGAGDESVVQPTADSAYNEGKERTGTVKPLIKDRRYAVLSLWHQNCTRCDSLTSKSLKEIEKEQEKLCVENYKVAFRAFRDCFNDSDSTTKTWKTKYPALSSEDNEKVIETLYKNWNNMFPSRSLSSVADDLKFLSSIDPYILGTYQTQETGSFLIQNYQRALKALANLASAVDKPMIADIIHVYLNEREFHPENNESYTVMCWGEPAYAFHGGSLDEKKRKWMKFAVNVAHVPEKVSDQIILNRAESTK